MSCSYEWNMSRRSSSDEEAQAGRKEDAAGNAMVEGDGGDGGDVWKERGRRRTKKRRR